LANPGWKQETMGGKSLAVERLILAPGFAPSLDVSEEADAQNTETPLLVPAAAAPAVGTETQKRETSH
jgi:hypothetical protein